MIESSEDILDQNTDGNKVTERTERRCERHGFERTLVLRLCETFESECARF